MQATNGFGLDAISDLVYILHHYNITSTPLSVSQNCLRVQQIQHAPATCLTPLRVSVRGVYKYEIHTLIAVNAACVQAEPCPDLFMLCIGRWAN